MSAYTTMIKGPLFPYAIEKRSEKATPAKKGAVKSTP